MTGGRSGMRRFEVPRNTRFLTFSCYRRLPLFRNDAIKAAFVQAIIASREAARFKLHGWVIMPEHVHLLLVPELPEFPVSRVLSRMKRPFARDVIARWHSLGAPILRRLTDSGGEVRFWLPGGGYDRNIRSVDDFSEKLAYIHRNPVSRGLVGVSTDWPWSSARWYHGTGDALIDIDPYC